MDPMNRRSTRDYPGEGAITGSEDFGENPTGQWTVEETAIFGIIDGPESESTPASTRSKSSKGKKQRNDAADTVEQRVDAGQQQVEQKVDAGKQQIEQKADAGIQKSAEGLHKAADKTRSMADEQSGTMSTIGTQAADAMEKGADYLDRNTTDDMIKDLEATVRRRPMESLLVAAGAGFLLSKILR